MDSMPENPRSIAFYAIVVLGLLLASQPRAAAATLQVAPVLVEVMAPSMASTLTLRNDGRDPVFAQIRVFRWTQEGGQERLEPTDEVVASPPSVTLARNTDYTVRVVRTTKRPLEGEESYRLFVDELPNPARQRNGAVSIVLRQSIPVFFGAPERSRPVVDGHAWRQADGRRSQQGGAQAAHLRAQAARSGR